MADLCVWTIAPHVPVPEAVAEVAVEAAVGDVEDLEDVEVVHPARIAAEFPSTREPRSLSNQPGKGKCKLLTG